MKKYKARIADKMLSRRLLGSGAVLIQGPKWCGKTTTAEQQAKSVVYMDDRYENEIPIFPYGSDRYISLCSSQG